MGQSNTGVVMRSGAETTLRYLQAKKKNWKTLTLKKIEYGNDHFQATADFSNSSVRSVDARNSITMDSVIPVLTSAVVPVGGGTVPLDAIPVLDKPVSSLTATTTEVPRWGNRRLTTAFLLVVGLGILMTGGANREQAMVQTLTVSTPEPVVKTISPPQVSKNTTANVVDRALVKNIIELIIQEKYSQETTIEAFLSRWRQFDGATRATLNSSPWFLRFTFALQKQARRYLQSPTSYNADYTIKFNALLKMAVALGVMDHHGIESSVETYYSKRNELLQTLKSEIATIENASKNHSARGESIEDLKKSFHDRFALQSRNVTEAKPRMKVNKKLFPKNKTSVIVPTMENVRQANPVVLSQDMANGQGIVEAVELETLLNTFIDAYERGDLETLTSLFSPAARTNDRNNLQDIRKDYASLFNSSTFRLLNIFNIRWTPGRNALKGIGDYEIGIAMDDSGTARMLHGKIQFVVGRVDKHLRITRLYHLER